jgi:hypothetical protein
MVEKKGHQLNHPHHLQAHQATNAPLVQGICLYVLSAFTERSIKFTEYSCGIQQDFWKKIKKLITRESIS